MVCRRPVVSIDARPPRTLRPTTVPDRPSSAPFPPPENPKDTTPPPQKKVPPSPQIPPFPSPNISPASTPPAAKAINASSSNPARRVASTSKHHPFLFL